MGKWNKFVEDYFLVQAEIALSMAIIGSLFAKEARVGFSCFFLPMILGAVCMLPCTILYIKEDMTVKQVICQRVLEAVFIVAVFEWMVWFLLRENATLKIYIVAAVGTMLFDIFTYVASDIRDIQEANDLNEQLAHLRTEEVADEDY